MRTYLIFIVDDVLKSMRGEEFCNGGRVCSFLVLTLKVPDPFVGEWIGLSSKGTKDIFGPNAQKNASRVKDQREGKNVRDTFMDGIA